MFQTTTTTIIRTVTKSTKNEKAITESTILQGTIPQAFSIIRLCIVHVKSPYIMIYNIQVKRQHDDNPKPLSINTNVMWIRHNDKLPTRHQHMKI